MEETPIIEIKPIEDGLPARPLHEDPRSSPRNPFNIEWASNKNPDEYRKNGAEFITGLEAYKYYGVKFELFCDAHTPCILKKGSRNCGKSGQNALIAVNDILLVCEHYNISLPDEATLKLKYKEEAELKERRANPRLPPGCRLLSAKEKREVREMARQVTREGW